MPLFAVSYIDWFDNDLITEFHSGETWKEALAKHSRMQREDMQGWITVLPEDQSKVQLYNFDCDSMIEVVPVPKLLPASPLIHRIADIKTDISQLWKQFFARPNALPPKPLHR